MTTLSYSIAEPALATSPLSALQAILSNPTDLAHVAQFATDDFTYVFLNFECPELRQIMPWAGTNRGIDLLVRMFVGVSEYWTVDRFEVQDTFENDDGAAVFGSFTYTSKVLDKTVTSPLAVLARGKGGRLSYVQFMEDTFATVRSFRESGEYLIKADPDGWETAV